MKCKKCQSSWKPEPWAGTCLGCKKNLPTLTCTVCKRVLECHIFCNKCTNSISSSEREDLMEEASPAFKKQQEEHKRRSGYTPAQKRRIAEAIWGKKAKRMNCKCMSEWKKCEDCGTKLASDGR